MRCPTGRRGVFVAGKPSIVKRSLELLPAGYASEVVAREQQVIPPTKLRFPRNLAGGSGSEEARPREVSFEVVRIKRVR